MNSCELVAYVSSIACVISKCSSREEMEILSAVLIQLGGNAAYDVGERGKLQSEKMR